MSGEGFALKEEPTRRAQGGSATPVYVVAQEGLGPLPGDWIGEIEAFRVTWLCDSFSVRSFQGF